MTTVLSNTENERGTNRRTRNMLAPRQPGSLGITQKQFTEPGSKLRQPLGVLKNSSRLHSTLRNDPSKHRIETVQIKPVPKSSTLLASAKSVKGSSTKTVVSSKMVPPEEFPDIESFPSRISTECSPFVPPSYFKTLTDSLKCTTILPSLPGNCLNMDSLTSVTLDLQQRPATLESDGMYTIRIQFPYSKFSSYLLMLL